MGSQDGLPLCIPRLTRLENQRPGELHISAIAGGLYALARANQRAYDEGGGLADGVEGPELYAHGVKTRNEVRETR